ncbi:UDP-sugar transporter sqv-7 domain protein [Teladorsagia circumcincta]|uniref:UDP-sugar transporter sqv-7 domain protein n=1 Tax=Teladorsagia circumcincta TaxID=45464 RepID=A0A2G9UET7_TELCI|nr:UDP-sugar transporter sqv-7 domain protein [Teladorsagia circumcincta]
MDLLRRRDTSWTREQRELVTHALRLVRRISDRGALGKDAKFHVFVLLTMSLPMFTVLRRFSILMTMVLEYYILGVKASRAVRVSVCMMIAGSIIAALFDLTFDLWGYTLIGLNDICTAALGVYTKQKLEAKELGKYGLMFYNSLFMLIPTFILICFTGDTDRNLFVTYVGMFSSGDYVFQWTNFIGINVSVMGSILYTYVTFRTKSVTQRHIVVTAASKVEKQPLI